MSHTWDTNLRVETHYSGVRYVCPRHNVCARAETETIVCVMARTDRETGFELEALIVHCLPNERHGLVTRIGEALGMSRSGYDRRKKREDFPSEEEIEKIADAFDLVEAGEPITVYDLKARFGILTPQVVEEEIAQAQARLKELRKMERFLAHPTLTATREEVKSSSNAVRDDEVRMDAPPL